MKAESNNACKCGTPLDVGDKCEECALKDFGPKDFFAFQALLGELVHQATGKTEVFISEEGLKNFPVSDAAKLKWDPATNGWTLKIAEETPVIIGVNKKFLKPRFG